jgi:tetratricopeptide (TPR) repeat protein
LANVVAAQGDYKEAATLYEQTIRLRPNAADPHCSLGMALVKLDRSSEAIVQFQEAIRLNRAYLPVYANLAEALAAAHQTADAIDIAKRGIDIANKWGNSAVADQLEALVKKYRGDE